MHREQAVKSTSIMMSELWSRITGAIAGWHKSRRLVAERQQAPRFICCCAVVWESGPLRGEGELRELSATGLRLRTDQPVLAGRGIRVRPQGVGSEQPLPMDMVFGTVVYSRSRKGKVDIGVELVNPERMSRYAWFHQLRREGESALPSFPPRRGGLHLVRGTTTSVGKTR